MKTVLILLTAGVLGIATQGCIYVHSEEAPSAGPPPRVPPPQQEAKYPQPLPAPDDTATFAEIDAAAQLTFDSGRLSALRNIAQRPHLSPNAQVRLVDSAYRRLTFDSSKVNLLLAIIENPTFSPPAKEAILVGLKGLSFDSSRQTILNALHRRATPHRS